MTDKAMEIIEVSPEMWADLMPMVNEIVATVAKVSQKHSLHPIVALGALAGAMVIIGENTSACECAGCAGVVATMGDEVFSRWENVVAANKGRAH